MQITVHTSEHIDAATAKQIQSYFNSLTESTQKTVSSNKDSFKSWLRNSYFGLYLKVSPYIDEIWSQVKEIATGLLEAIGVGAAAVVATPIIGVVEGIKEGLDNGFEAGVSKAFKSMGEVLDDLFS